jgi:threonine aldolase
MKQEMLIALKIEVLKDVRVILRNRHRNRICAALSLAAARKNYELDVLQVTNGLKVYIGESLDTHLYLESWCAENGFVKYSYNAHGARLKWVTWMIRCLRKDLAKLEKAKK